MADPEQGVKESAFLGVGIITCQCILLPAALLY